MKEKLKKAKGYVKEYVTEIVGIAVVALGSGIITGACAVHNYAKGFNDGAFAMGEAALLANDCISNEEKAEHIKTLHKHVYGK